MRCLTAFVVVALLPYSELLIQNGELSLNDLNFIKESLYGNIDSVSPLATDNECNFIMQEFKGHRKCITSDEEFGFCVHKYKCNQYSINVTDICGRGSGMTCCSISNLHPVYECGRSKSVKTFNNGFASHGEFPWMVAVMRKANHGRKVNNYLRGGTIIHPYVVITTATKVHNLKAKQVLCRAGFVDFHLEAAERNVENIIIHDEFSEPQQINDIAMLVLKEPFVFGDTIGSVCINYTMPLPETLSQCFSTGWGQQFQHKGRYTGILKKVEVKYIDFKKCQALLDRTNIRDGFELHPSHLCASGVGDDDVYIDDGGSPLVCRSKDSTMYTLLGMVGLGFSSGDRITSLKLPSVYVNIHHLHSWIDTKMEEKGM